MADTLENIHDNKLEHQIRKVLNAIDDELVYRDFIESKCKKIKSSKKTSKKENAFDLSGWIPHRSVTLRKIERYSTEGDKDPNRELISWKEQCGICPSDRHYYHFKHYKDVKKYIEQYRKECVCLRNTVIPKTNECLDIKRIRTLDKNKHLRSTPTSSPTKNGESKPSTFSYTNRGASLLTKLADTVYNNDYNADDVKCGAMDVETKKQGSRNTSCENQILSPIKGMNSPRTIDKLKSSVQYLEKSEASIIESEYSDTTEISDKDYESAVPILSLSDSTDDSTNIASQENVAVAANSPPHDQLENELNDSYSESFGGLSCDKDSPQSIDSESKRPINGRIQPSYPDTRFVEKKLVTSPEFPLVKSVPTVPISEMNHGEKVWKPTNGNDQLNRLNELEKERLAGINHPFRSKHPFREIDNDDRYISISDNINPPGKIRPILIQSNTNTSQFPQPMCYSFKKDSVKMGGTLEGQKKMPIQKSSSASDVFKAKHEFSDIARSPSTPKYNRRESSYRQKLYLPTGDIKSPRLEYTVKKDSYSYSETPISMPSIYMYKHGLRGLGNKDTTAQDDSTSHQLPSLTSKPSTDNTTQKKQCLQISEYTPTMNNKPNPNLPAVDIDIDSQPNCDNSQETQRKVLPRKLKAHKDIFTTYNISEKKIKKFVEMKCCEHNSTKQKLIDDSLSHGGPSIAHGMWFDSNGRAYVSLASRYEPVKK